MRKTILTAGLSITFLILNAQTPAGFTRGSITNTDGTVINGYVKDNLKKDASIIYMDENKNKHAYDGGQIKTFTIDSVNYITIKGDFFRTICVGKICFLQKASDASNKPVYNGNEAIFIYGTPGKIGDYFSLINNDLKLINKKSLTSFINNQFAACKEATEKANTINGDIAQLSVAINIFNNQSK